MQSPATEVARIANDILVANARLLTHLVSTRKRFENWLHIEILATLLGEMDGIEIEVERPYPDSRERCDLWLRCADGEETWIELKCCVTNYCSAFTQNISARPITNQISDILRDQAKLNRIGGGRLEILLVAYPLPSDYSTHYAWSGHISKLKESGLNVEEAFSIMLKREEHTASVVGYRLMLGAGRP